MHIVARNWRIAHRLGSARRSFETTSTHARMDAGMDFFYLRVAHTQTYLYAYISPHSLCMCLPIHMFLTLTSNLVTLCFRIKAASIFSLGLAEPTGERNAQVSPNPGSTSIGTDLHSSWWSSKAGIQIRHLGLEVGRLDRYN